MEAWKTLEKNMERRKVCRKFYKEKRESFTWETVSEKSKKICKKVLESTAYQTADVIYGYYPLGKEVNCLSILECALKDGKQVALPKTNADHTMNFYEIKSLLDVEEGRFHLLEPKAGCEKIKTESGGEQQKKVLVLVPGVVFDREGNRYGYGGGFYDRYFEKYPRLIRMALAYREQVTEGALECLPTDIKMHTIITEDENIEIRFR